MNRLPRSALIGILSLAISFGASIASTGPVWAAEKSKKKILPKDTKKFQEAERKRDKATKAKPLARDRVLERYTNKKELKKEIRKGSFHDNTHFGNREDARGRAMTSENAKATKGIPSKKKIDTRVLIKAFKGEKWKTNKAWSGKPGEQEWTNEGKLPVKNRILSISPTQEGKSESGRQ